jgi:hypothetical protein
MQTSFTYGFPDFSYIDTPESEPVQELVDFYETWIRPEDIDLKRADNFIQGSFLSYVKAGMALHWLRVKKGTKFFQQYARETLQKTPHYAAQVVKAARITWELILAGFTKLPTCISQALPLAKYFTEDRLGLADNSTLFDKWNEILKLAEGKPITSALIKVCCDGVTDEDKPVATKLPRELYEKLAKEAVGRGCSVQKLLEEILSERYADNDAESGPEPEYTEEQEEILRSVESLFQATQATQVTQSPPKRYQVQERQSRLADRLARARANQRVVPPD